VYCLARLEREEWLFLVCLLLFEVISYSQKSPKSLIDFLRASKIQKKTKQKKAVTKPLLSTLEHS
jgi:hypothetical protein